jgi:hypothetical protein
VPSVPYHVGFLNESNTTLSVWPIPVTTATAVGDGIVVFISSANVHTITSVTDTQSNTYNADQVDTNQAAWSYIAAAPINQLTTSDTISVNWSGTNANVGCVGCIGTPGCNKWDNSGVADGVSNLVTVTKTPTSGSTCLFCGTWNSAVTGALSGGSPNPYAAVANLAVTGVKTSISGMVSGVGSQSPLYTVTGTPSWSGIAVNMLLNPTAVAGSVMQRRAAYGQQR